MNCLIKEQFKRRDFQLLDSISAFCKFSEVQDLDSFNKDSCLNRRFGKEFKQRKNPIKWGKILFN
ncbi:hypothetical protein LEP1GSC050_1780 [Leptospira broomii serovar Hurstbridge str. 5399]|uniref:Uncharacterized protein n=1 Tax=Leptospira broomii serovar Hurstbridge str. 5399 TaxID=1049789 RepID=T0G8W0_9LEPT|nr:hypothetical protein LEP1GSC050_1780 [Leptospira broomii serovar Hurstbridge str. 5399]